MDEVVKAVRAVAKEDGIAVEVAVERGEVLEGWKILISSKEVNIERLPEWETLGFIEMAETLSVTNNPLNVLVAYQEE